MSLSSERELNIVAFNCPLLALKYNFDVVTFAAESTSIDPTIIGYNSVEVVSLFASTNALFELEVEVNAIFAFPLDPDVTETVTDDELTKFNPLAETVEPLFAETGN